MDRNVRRRKRCREMPQDNKNDLLRRRQQSYAAKRRKLLPSALDHVLEPVATSQAAPLVQVEASVLIPRCSGQCSHGQAVVPSIGQLREAPASQPVDHSLACMASTPSQLCEALAPETIERALLSTVSSGTGCPLVSCANLSMSVLLAT